MFTTNTAGTALSTAGALQAANIVAGFEFTGSQNVNIVLATVATANDFCLVGSNTNFGAVPTDGWWTYSKSKGGLQTDRGASRWSTRLSALLTATSHSHGLGPGADTAPGPSRPGHPRRSLRRPGDAVRVKRGDRTVAAQGRAARSTPRGHGNSMTAPARTGTPTARWGRKARGLLTCHGGAGQLPRPRVA